MDQVGKILAKKNKNSPLMRGIQASLAVEFFHELMKNEWGSQIEELARAISLKNKILTIACLNSVMANEIKMREDKFVNLINEKFGIDTVERLKIML